MNRIIKGFFTRRILRIAPPLFFFVIVTYILSLLFIPPGSTLSLLSQRSAVTSLFGISNLYFYKQSLNYFGSLAELNPFTHTWSLGVEEQFYIVFPFLFLAFRRRIKGRRTFFLAATALFIISLIFFYTIYHFNQPAAYFLPQSRSHQFLLGITLFYSTLHFTYSHPIFSCLSNVSLPSVLLILFCPFQVSSPLSHFAVTLSFSFLLLRSSSSTPLTTFYSNPVITFLGATSYSLYLWHWPIIVFSKYLSGTLISNPIVITLLTFLVSTLSFFLLERRLPDQLSKLSGRPFFLFSYPLSASFLALVPFLLYPQRHTIFLSRFLDSSSSPSTYNSTCPHRQPFSIVGDSHAFNSTQQDCSSSLVISSSIPGTPFPPTLYSNSIAGLTLDDTKISYQDAYSAVVPKLRSSPPHDVFLVNRLDYYFSKPTGSFKHDRITHFSNTGSSITQEHAYSLWLRDLKLLAQQYPNHKFIVVLPVPSFGKLYPASLCTKALWRPHPEHNCSEKISAIDHHNRMSVLKQPLQHLVDTIPNLSIYDPSSLNCDLTACSTHIHSRRIYLDDNHLNRHGAIILNKHLSEYRTLIRK